MGAIGMPQGEPHPGGAQLHIIISLRAEDLLCYDFGRK